MAKPINPRAVQEANLIAGGTGSQILVRTKGLSRTAYALAFVLNDFSKSLDSLHKNQLKKILGLARDNWDAQSGRRGGEHGNRPRARQTGKMTFGASGNGAIKGVLIIEPEKQRSGFGFPNVPHADQRTKYVWRTLEFGLRPHPEAVQGSISRGGVRIGAERPKGVHKLPRRFSFSSSNPATSRLIPLAKPAESTATFVRLHGKKKGVAIRKKVRAGGIPPMFFISDAIGVVAQQIGPEYRRVVARTYGRR